MSKDQEIACLLEALEPVVHMDESSFYAPFEHMPVDSYIFGSRCSSAILKCREKYKEYLEKRGRVSKS